MNTTLQTEHKLIIGLLAIRKAIREYFPEEPVSRQSILNKARRGEFPLKFALGGKTFVTASELRDWCTCRNKYANPPGQKRKIK
jgi:hypothetical protein